MSLPTQLLHLRLAAELLPQVDEAAAKVYVSRSEFIRQAIVEKLRANTTNAFPSHEGLNMLMTDWQLEEMWQILRHERDRRVRRGLNY